MLIDKIRKLATGKRVSTADLMLIAEELYMFALGMAMVMDAVKANEMQNQPLDEVIELGFNTVSEQYAKQ